MARLIPMPKWGMTMQEVTIGTWLKAEGARVEAGEDIVEIESDKAIQLVKLPPRESSPGSWLPPARRFRSPRRSR